MGLYITVWQLNLASGIESKIIKKDISSNVLSTRIVDNETVIYYLDALNYVQKKWNECTSMYPIESNDTQAPRNFAERLLTHLDDGFSPAQISLIQKLDKNGKTIK